MVKKCFEFGFLGSVGDILFRFSLYFCVEKVCVFPVFSFLFFLAKEGGGGFGHLGGFLVFDEELEWLRRN